MIEVPDDIKALLDKPVLSADELRRIEEAVKPYRRGGHSCMSTACLCGDPKSLAAPGVELIPPTAEGLSPL